MRPAIEQTLIFDNAVEPFQTDWLGVCANYMLFAAFSEFGLSEAQKTAEWDRVQRSGVKIVRTFYDPSWSFADYPNGSPSWTTPNMLAFYEGVAAMKVRGIKVVINTGWSFTGGICIPFAGVASAVTPTPTMEATWAAWLSESFNQLINVRGYDNVIGGVLFTEPNFGILSEPIPVGYTGLEYYVHMASVLDAKIVSDDASRTPIRPRIILVGGQEQSGTDADTWIEYLAAHDTKCDILSSHSYNISPTYAPLGLVGSNDLSYAALISRFSDWSGDASPRPMWVDEGNTTVGGDTDSTGYRATADAGTLMLRWFAGHMQAGCQATFPWTLQDEKYWPSPADAVTQQYGVAKSIHDSSDVRPSWYALSMYANLTGGGDGTKLYRAINGTDTLHGTGVWIPQGVRNATNADGEYTFVAINETALPLRTQVRFKTPIGGRTIYRYVYSAEVPPATADDPAYLLAWDQRYTGITKNITPNVIPGRSVVVYSTINLQAPTSVNMALSAVASTDSLGVGPPDNANDGNFSNVQGTWNGWRKADGSTHYLQLDWDEAVSIGRVEVALVGTTPGVVYATYIDTTEPPPLSDYTIETWDGASWVEQASVTGNSDPNRSHTFTPVSTTKLRLNAAGAAVASQVNQIGVHAV